MIYALILLSYVATLCVLYSALRSIDTYDIGFLDGIVVGATYFVMVPLSVILITGEMRDDSMRAAPFRPYEDITTTINLLLGVSSIAGTSLIYNRFRTNARKTYGPKRKKVNLTWRVSDTYVLATTYVLLTVTVFFMSGKNAGGHWMENMHAAFQADTKFIAISNFANTIRASIFGVILFSVLRGHFSRVQGVLLALCIASFDMAVTFNRITFAYFFIMLVILYKARIPLLTAGVAAASVPLSMALSWWSTFRAVALNDGFSVASISKAAKISSHSASLGHDKISAVLNSLFESGNLMVFNHIVKMVPDKFEPLYGYTFLLRPITVFIPSTLWQNKPPVFGTLVGQEIQGIRGLALNSTLFGEAYANFYLLWIPFLLAALLAVESLFRLLGRRSRTYSFAAFFVAIACWRFDFNFAAVSIVTIGLYEIFRTVLSVSRVALVRSAR